MTETQQLIEQVRKRLNGVTDYKMAQALDIPRNVIHYYIKGERSADAYACAKIAEALGRDPLAVIAQVEAEAAKTEKKRAYWRTFFSSMRHKTHVLALSATFLGLNAGWPSGNAEAAREPTSHNGGLRYILRRLTQRRTTRRGVDRRRLVIN